MVVQNPLHRGPSDLVTEVRERPADPCVPPLGILDRHPDRARESRPVAAGALDAERGDASVTLGPGDQLLVAV